MAAQVCWSCGEDVEVDVMLWLDASGLPVVWTDAPRPAAPAGYHPACGAALRALRGRRGPSAGTPAPAPAPPRGQMRLF